MFCILHFFTIYEQNFLGLFFRDEITRLILIIRLSNFFWKFQIIINFWWKDEENSYQIQIIFKKSESFEIEAYFSAKICNAKKITVSFYIYKFGIDSQLQTSLKCLF